MQYRNDEHDWAEVAGNRLGARQRSQDRQSRRRAAARRGEVNLVRCVDCHAEFERVGSSSSRCVDCR